VRVVSGDQVEEDWYLMAPVTVAGPRGDIEVCAFVSATDPAKVVLQVLTDAWDEDGAGVQITYNDADAAQYRR
jgi:hypothetical protein